MEIRLDGKCVIVTGAGSGIGAATARELAESGATVIVSDLKPETAEEQAAELRSAGGRAAAFAADMRDRTAVRELVAFACHEAGGLYGLVNNAGISLPGAPTGELDPEVWDEVLSVNLTGVFNGMRYAIPAMLESGGGSVVNVASILGGAGFANAAAYVSAKHGVIGATRSAALEYATRGIRVNAVAPGFIRTPLIARHMTPEGLQRLEALHPMRRLGEAGEIAALITFLLSDRASFITGSCHHADGGYTAQ